MRSKVLAPRRRAWLGVRVLGVCVAAATMAGVGSCGSSSGGSTVTVSGTTLTIYASVPTGTPDGADVFDAEKLALGTTTKIGKYTIRFKELTDPEVSNSARTAIEDLTTIAYLGEIVPGVSADSLGITNAQDVLQVTPSDTALELTQKTAAVPGAPGKYYEQHGAYGQTFARVVPTTGEEARAQVQEMQSLGVRSLYVGSDGSPYGATVAQSVKNAAAAAGLHALSGSVTASALHSAGADALFYGGASTGGGATAAGKLLSSVASQNNGLKLFVPSALDTDTFLAGFGTAGAQLYASRPGFRAQDLNPEGKQFVSSFASTYGHTPAPKAIFAYEAMKAVLAVLQEAGASANDRTTVVKDFLAIKNRPSALGTYSISSTGDTSIAPFVFSRLRAGELVPFAFVSPPQG
jgi:hypothetical protein